MGILVELSNNLQYIHGLSLHLHSTIVPLQLLLANPPDLRLLLLSQPLPHAGVYLDDADGLGVVHHLHILEAFEGIGEDMRSISLSAVSSNREMNRFSADEPVTARSAVVIGNPLNPR